jgi:hypothetical protein
VTEIDPEDIIFSMPSLLPTAHLTGIRYLVSVDPEGYDRLEGEAARARIADGLTLLNDRLPAGAFAILGPGRWGTLNSRDSVPVSYSDVCNSRFLVEIGPHGSLAPELAFGTDFYEDLTEAGILVMGLQAGAPGTRLRWDLLREAANELERVLPELADIAPHLHVIDLVVAMGGELGLVVDDEADRATAYIIRPDGDGGE